MYFFLEASGYNKNMFSLCWIITVFWWSVLCPKMTNSSLNKRYSGKKTIVLSKSKTIVPIGIIILCWRTLLQAKNRTFFGILIILPEGKIILFWRKKFSPEKNYNSYSKKNHSFDKNYGSPVGTKNWDFKFLLLRK